MRGDQLARQWRILQHIEASRKGLSAMELAELLDVTPRTVYRDLAALQEAGFPLFSEKNGEAKRWAFVDSYKFRLPQPFTMTELMALHMYGQLSRVFEGTFFYDSLESLYNKVRATLPEQSVRYLEAVQDAFSMHVKPYKNLAKIRGIIQQVTQSLPQRHSLEIVYGALSTGEETVRRVDPYKVHFHDGALYLVGYCHLRGEVRTFALDRIRLARTTEHTFAIPEDFSIEEYFGDSFGVWRDHPENVRIRISPDWARWVGEKTWHESQVSEKLADGSLELTFRVAGLDEIRRWVLSMGHHAVVLEPEQLAREVRESLARALDHYGAGAEVRREQNPTRR